jgi:hypothetical protein
VAEETSEAHVRDPRVAGSCAGKVQLAAKVDLPMDNANLVLPDANATPDEVDASPIADAVKTALATALAVVKGDIKIKSIIKTTARRRLGADASASALASTRRRLDVDGIAVDYAVELDATAAAAAKTASASMTVPDVTIPASANGGVALTVLSADIVPAPLVSYAWVTTKATCPTACGTGRQFTASCACRTSDP